jgi:hypothetical protein
MTDTKKGSYFIHLFPLDTVDLSLFSLVSFKSFYFKKFLQNACVLDSVFLIDGWKNPGTGKDSYRVMVYVELGDRVSTPHSFTIFYMGETINSFITDYGMRKLALAEIAKSWIFKAGYKKVDISIFISTIPISEIASYTI